MTWAFETFNEQLQWAVGKGDTYTKFGRKTLKELQTRIFLDGGGGGVGGICAGPWWVDHWAEIGQSILFKSTQLREIAAWGGGEMLV